MNKPEIATSFVNEKEALTKEVKNLIVRAVNLHHLDPDEITAGTPFGPDGLNLDSVDILEIVVAVEQRYKVKVKDADIGRRSFRSAGDIADFILEHRG